MATLEQLVANHSTLLLDAMGVLINANGPVTHAPEFIDYLNHCQKRYFILTNICGDTEHGIYERLRRNGIPLLSAESVISAGSLVRKYIDTVMPTGSTIAFIGPETCRSVLATRSRSIVACGETPFFDALALLDDEGFPFRDTLEAALSSYVCIFETTGNLPRLLLANSDMAYPRTSNSYAFGSGIFATMLSEALMSLLGMSPEVVCFGKPSDRMFAEAQRRSGDRSMMMIGDQLATDILGANRFGITSTLVLTGLNTRQDIDRKPIVPHHVIDDLRIELI